MKTKVELLTNTDIAELISRTCGRIMEPVEAKNLAECARRTTTVWAGYIDGDLVCIWGLVPPTLLSNVAYLWMHATEKVGDHEFVFVRKSQRILEELLKVYPMIYGHCEAGADRSIRWLRWLGAKFGKPEGKFVPFIIRADNG